jgi:hypothetical protein
MMMRRPEFLMMRHPAPPYKRGSIGTYYTIGTVQLGNNIEFVNFW